MAWHGSEFCLRLADACRCMQMHADACRCLQAEGLHSWPWQESLNPQKPRNPGATFDSKRGLQRLWQALASSSYSGYSSRRSLRKLWGADADGGEDEFVATDGFTEPRRKGRPRDPSAPRLGGA